MPTPPITVPRFKFRLHSREEWWSLPAALFGPAPAVAGTWGSKPVDGIFWEILFSPCPSTSSKQAKGPDQLAAQEKLGITLFALTEVIL